MSKLHKFRENELPYHHDWKPVIEVSYGVQVKWFGCWGNDPNWFIETSRLASDLICFFYLKKGECTAMVNGALVSMKRGDLLVIRSGDVFSFEQNPDAWQLSLSACLSVKQDSETNVLLNSNFKRLSRIQDQQKYEQTFDAVMKALESEGRWKSMSCTGALFTWLGVLHEELRPEKGGMHDLSKTVKHVLRAQEWVMQRLSEKISIAGWADQCGLNVDYFSRLFKSHTGLGPKAWLTERRLQSAAQFLVSSGDTVESVAYRCRFSCAFHFSRSFKKRFGVSPVQYRSIRQS